MTGDGFYNICGSGCGRAFPWLAAGSSRWGMAAASGVDEFADGGFSVDLKACLVAGCMVVCSMHTQKTPQSKRNSQSGLRAFLPKRPPCHPPCSGAMWPPCVALVPPTLHAASVASALVEGGLLTILNWHQTKRCNPCKFSASRPQRSCNPSAPSTLVSTPIYISKSGEILFICRQTGLTSTSSSW